jgi:hypothetical protein
MLTCSQALSLMRICVLKFGELRPTDHPLRGDLAEEYLKDRKKFMKNAEDHTKKYSEKRPSD